MNSGSLRASCRPVAAAPFAAAGVISLWVEEAVGVAEVAEVAEVAAVAA